jgi:hypothetical protein
MMGDTMDSIKMNKNERNIYMMNVEYPTRTRLHVGREVSRNQTRVDEDRQHAIVQKVE